MDVVREVGGVGRSKRAVVSLSRRGEVARNNPCKTGSKSGVDAAVGGPSIAKRQVAPTPCLRRLTRSST